MNCTTAIPLFLSFKMKLSVKELSFCVEIEFDGYIIDCGMTSRETQEGDMK